MCPHLAHRLRVVAAMQSKTKALAEWVRTLGPINGIRMFEVSLTLFPDYSRITVGPVPRGFQVPPAFSEHQQDVVAGFKTDALAAYEAAHEYGHKKALLRLHRSAGKPVFRTDVFPGPAQLRPEQY